MENEDPIKTDTDPLRSATPETNITLYEYNSESHDPPEFAILDASALYDTGDIESQDSGFGCASALEVDIKDQIIDPPEETRLITRGTSLDELPPSH